MKPFTYLTPVDADEAVRLLDTHGPDARVIAGGQTLLLAMKTREARPTALVSLTSIEGLSGVSVDDTGELVVGATTTYAELARTDLPGWHAEITAMAGNLADRPVRTMGTIGGALCAAEPRFDMPVLVTGVGAILEVLSPTGVRLLRPEEFFDTSGGTTLTSSDLLVAVRFPALESFTAVAFEKFRQRTFDAAIVSSLCALQVDGQGRVIAARITVGAATPVPTPAPQSAAGLVGLSTANIDPAQVGNTVAVELRHSQPADSPMVQFQTELIKSVTRKALTRACAISRS